MGLRRLDILSVFFYEPETIRRLFFPSKPLPGPLHIKKPEHAIVLLSFLSLYFCLQVALPLRHHFIQGDVLWTEEGHRMSWRMMLRSRSGGHRADPAGRLAFRQTGP